MSFAPCPDPVLGDARSVASIETVVVSRAVDLGGLEVRRALPSTQRQMVGPFIFFDQMGPAEFLTDRGIDVRPHPHINLATVTYLLDGEIMHRDSIGTEMTIRPGDVNWMRAGRGIVHSERSPQAQRTGNGRLFGLQTWVALPAAMEESDPAFLHHEQSALPFVEDGGLTMRLIAGSLQGVASPLATASETLYADVALAAGARWQIDPTHDERALYVLTGTVTVDGARWSGGTLLVLARGAHVEVAADEACRLMLFGGDPMEGPRYIWWNFVSSRPERIEAAKAEWAAGRFDTVPGDETEFIPLPDMPGKPRRATGGRPFPD